MLFEDRPMTEKDFKKVIDDYEDNSLTSDNASYKFERGYPASGTAERAYYDTNLGRAIAAYKFFIPQW
jgi:hypothetical protein